MRILFKQLTIIALGLGPGGIATATPILLANADFSASPHGVEQDITGWAEFVGTGDTPDANYTEDLEDGLGHRAFLKANDGNYIAQTLEGADTAMYEQIDVSFDAGMRTATTEGQTNHGLDCTVRISIWDVDADAELAGQDHTVVNPGQVTPNTITPVSISLAFDNAPATPHGIQLRVTHAGPGKQDLGNSSGWRATVCLDNFELDGVMIEPE